METWDPNALGGRSTCPQRSRACLLIACGETLRLAIVPNMILFKDWSLNNVIELLPATPGPQSFSFTEKWQAALQSRYHAHNAGIPTWNDAYCHVVICEGATATAHPGQPACHFPADRSVAASTSLLVFQVGNTATDDATHLVQVGGNRAAKKPLSVNSGWEISSAHTC